MLSFYLLLGPPDPKRPRALTAAERAAKYRANRFSKKKEEDLETQKAAMIKLRKEQTTEEREAVKDKKKAARQEQTAEKRQASKKTQKEAMTKL